MRPVTRTLSEIEKDQYKRPKLMALSENMLLPGWLNVTRSTMDKAGET